MSIMKNVYPAKSSFDKLYLIKEEMYNKVLPKLSEIEKHELFDLQERYKPFEDSGELNSEENDQTFSKPEISKDQIDPIRNEASEEKSYISKPSKPYFDGTTNQYLATNTEKPLRKEKKFACDRCINKKFTTKQSLKRHYKTFHTPKQFIKQNEEPAEISLPSVISPTIPSNIEFKNSEEPMQLKPNLKRKFSDDDDTLNEEPVQKSVRFTQGTKRKLPEKDIDNLPRKKFHWTSF